MGIWAEIKHALNSTLGTSEFKPLDQVVLYNGKSLIASNTAYLDIVPKNNTVSVSGNNSALSTAIEVCTFKPKVSGSVKLLTNLNLYDDNTNMFGYAIVTIYRNGQSVNKITLDNASADYNGNALVSTSPTITFDADDVITVKLQAQTSTGTGYTQKVSVTVNNMQIRADTKDKLIEV